MPKLLVGYIIPGGAVVQEPPGTLIRGLSLPNSASPGNFHPHLIDLYVPDGDRLHGIILLHGGGGSREEAAQSFWINRGQTPSEQTANWALLQTFKTIVAIPQGWTDPVTVNANNPQGTASWNNNFMNDRAPSAGYDDVQMIEDLANHIANQYGVLTISLGGHSNGGMMARHIAKNHDNAIFDRYFSISGPFANQSATSSQLPNKPYYGIFGQLDDVLNIDTGSASWTDATWYQGISTLSPADNLYPSLGSYSGEFHQLQAQVTACGSSETVQQGDGVTTAVRVGSKIVWQYASGRVKLQLNTAAGHSQKSHLTATGVPPIVDILKFCVAT